MRTVSETINMTDDGYTECNNQKCIYYFNLFKSVSSVKKMSTYKLSEKENVN